MKVQTTERFAATFAFIVFGGASVGLLVGLGIMGLYALGLWGLGN
jgi:hypothetical protein